MKKITFQTKFDFVMDDLVNKVVASLENNNLPSNVTMINDYSLDTVVFVGDGFTLTFNKEELENLTDELIESKLKESL